MLTSWHCKCTFAIIQDAPLIRTTILRFVQVTWLEQWIGKAPVGTAGSGCTGLSGLLMAWLWFLVSWLSVAGSVQGSGASVCLGGPITAPVPHHHRMLLLPDPALCGLWPMAGDDKLLTAIWDSRGLALGCLFPSGEPSLHGYLAQKCLWNLWLSYLKLPVCIFCSCNIKGNIFSKIIAWIQKVILTFNI